MKKYLQIALATVLVLSIMVATAPTSSANADDSKALAFNTMTGVTRPFTRNNGNEIRGIDGGGLPWVIDYGSGKLKPNGELNVQVKGLVFDPNDPDAIAAGVAGRNTIPFFKAIVSCLSVDTAGNASIVNVATQNFPADEAGNALIKETLSLPEPCIAPIIFVTSPTGLWFATTGF